MKIQAQKEASNRNSQSMGRRYKGNLFPVLLFAGDTMELNKLCYSRKGSKGNPFVLMLDYQKQS